jgi:hypothetical protein
MSVFHRVDDIYRMRADLFFRRAVLLTAYDGALAAKQAAQRDQAKNLIQGSVQARPSTSATEDELWAAHRRKHYAQFLRPGEQVQEIGMADFMAIMSTPAASYG